MTTKCVIALLLSLCLELTPGHVRADTDNENLAAIKQLAETYITATYEGDATTLRKIFHQSAVMNGYLDGKLLLGGPEPFINQIAKSPLLKSAGAAYKAIIEYLHASGDIGSITISETGYGPKSFTNYLSVLKLDGEWKIVSKTFYDK